MSSPPFDRDSTVPEQDAGGGKNESAEESLEALVLRLRKYNRPDNSVAENSGLRLEPDDGVKTI